MAVIKPSLPKGTRDFLPQQMLIRNYVIDTLKGIFENFGYEPLETPSIEKLEVLSGKYGDEGESLIFKVLKRGTGLEDLLKGSNEFTVKEYGDLVNEALRYDLTVPLSRVIAMYQNEITFPFKRYQIQPVWRADRPQRGRYREFYQCDVDIVGTSSMLADAEIIAIVDEVFTTLGFKKFKIRLNNRKILNGILESVQIAPELGSQVLIAIDKMDKIGIDGVTAELEKKGLSNKETNKIVSILELSGEPKEVLDEIVSAFKDAQTLKEGCEQLQEIISYLEAFNIPKANYQIDFFLVRGLGYYTGPIYESIVEEPKVGSLSGGGRYDKLVGIFLGRDIPATGTSFGIERIIDVMTELETLPQSKTKTRVLVTLFDETTRQSSLTFIQELRKEGIASEIFLELVKLKKQFSYADKKKIPFVAIIGPDEQSAEKVTIKDMQTGEQTTFNKEDCINFVKGT